MEETFLKNSSWYQTYLTITEYLSGVYFWVKDTECKFQMVNKNLVQLCGKKTELELIGQTDFNIWPITLAKSYSADDHYVMKTGKSLKKKMELIIKGRSSVRKEKVQREGPCL